MKFFTIKRVGTDLNGNTKYLIQGFYQISQDDCHLYIMPKSMLENIVGRWSDKKEGNISKLNKHEMKESILKEYPDAFYAYN